MGSCPLARSIVLKTSESGTCSGLNSNSIK